MITIEKDLHLPDSLREQFKKPMGDVVECYDLLPKLKKVDKLVTIGDSVSSFFIRQGAPPNLIIWDGNTKRHPIDQSTQELLSEFAPEKEVENPPATITKEAWNAVSEALKEKKASVLVHGEEDLLAIPAILNAEEGTHVVYGHPPGKGAVLIVVNDKIKSLFQELLSKFE
jgi:hypothetical protein